MSQDGNLKGTYTYNSLEQLASRVITNAGAFNGTVHTTQDRSGNVIAEADGTTGVVAKEYIWLPGAGYAGTDLPVGVVDVAGTATPELLYVHADHVLLGAADSRSPTGRRRTIGARAAPSD